MSRVLDTKFQQHLATKAKFACRGRSLSHVIRLHRTDRNNRVGFVPERFGHDEFQLARLVAARREAGAIVALDIDLRSTQVLAESRHVFQCCRQMRQADPRKP